MHLRAVRVHHCVAAHAERAEAMQDGRLKPVHLGKRRVYVQRVVVAAKPVDLSLPVYIIGIAQIAQKSQLSIKYT